jgi:hypothetical protein
MKPENVWEHVRAFAEEARRKRMVIPTLTKGIPNRIVDVHAGSIGRRSTAGRTNSSRVNRAQVLKVWATANRPGGAPIPEGVLYFTPALMMKALPGLLRFADGIIARVGDRQYEVRKNRSRKLARKRLGVGGGAGGESEKHKELKKFIFKYPDRALRSLGGAPYVALEMEYWFRTNDEVDVVLRDKDNNAVLVEVKTHIRATDNAPWGQAAKYRTLWAFFEGEPESSIRTVVAAPRVPAKLAASLKRQYGIDSVSVRL